MLKHEIPYYYKNSSSLETKIQPAVSRAIVNSCLSFYAAKSDTGPKLLPEYEIVKKSISEGIVDKYLNSQHKFTPASQFKLDFEFTPQKTKLLLANSLSIIPVTPADFVSFSKSRLDMMTTEDEWRKYLQQLEKKGMVSLVRGHAYQSTLVPEAAPDFGTEEKHAFMEGAYRGFTQFNQNIPRDAAHIIKFRRTNVQERGKARQSTPFVGNYAIFDVLSSPIMKERYGYKPLEAGQFEFFLKLFEKQPYAEAASIYLLSHRDINDKIYDSDKLPDIMRFGPEALNATESQLRLFGLLDQDGVTCQGERISGILTRTPCMIMPFKDDIEHLSAKDSGRKHDLDVEISTLTDVLAFASAKDAMLRFSNDWNEINERVASMKLDSLSMKWFLDKYYSPWDMERKWNLSRKAFKGFMSNLFNSGVIGPTISSHTSKFEK